MVKDTWRVTEIELLLDNPDDAYVDRFKFEERYHSVVAAARKVIADEQARQQAKTSGSVSGSEVTGGTKNFIRLPKIDLPRYDGSYQCWLEYRDTFLSLIHNNTSIDNINKFHYLRASLKGQAAEVIKNIDFRSDNYVLAWNLLCERYDNSRLLINNHVKALFNAEPIINESSAALRSLVDVTNKNIRALTLLNEPTRDTLIIYLMTLKLDSTTSRDWEEHRTTLGNSPTLLEFCKFMNNKADLLETLEENKKLDKVQHNNSIKSKSFIVTSLKQQTNNTEKDKSQITCPLCSQNHYLYSCVAFKKLTIEERVQKVKEFKVCMNCLRVGHTEKRCRFSRCKYCKERHNTLLHLDQPALQVYNPMPVVSSNSVSLSADIQPASQKYVLLSTAMVKVLSHNGKRYNARVLLDSGSTANFITDQLCNILGLSRVDATSTVTGINGLTSNSTQSCNLTIESTYEHYSFNINCLILSEITSRLPASYINTENIPIPSGLVLADPSYNIPSDVDILLGAELFWNVIQANHINLGKNLPKLCESKLGWLISGAIPANMQKQTHICNFSKTSYSPDLSKFWELDTISSKHCLSVEEHACEESFKLNTVRGSKGQFIVSMPLKEDPSVLGNSYVSAKRRFLSLEKRFERDPIYKSLYIDFMNEYETLGHMTEDSELSVSDKNNKVSYFMPHHGVLRESSETTKLRTVFDASSKSTTGLSLNDIQNVGPTVQSDLLSILLRFRQHKYVISGDIEKMYRAIELNPKQRSLQRIIFRKDPSEPLKTYTLNTVTYGTASAPYLATKCLASLAEATDDHDVQSSIQRDFYVDDLLCGKDTIEGAIELCQNIKRILSSANFNLRKFKSNNAKILEKIVNIEDNTCLDLDLSNTHASKTLGLLWNCQSDILSFSINIDTKTTITKRHILSIISQIFDPLGLIGPIVVEAKILMQTLWVNKCDWDDEVPQDIVDQWLKFVDALKHLNSLHIPRWVIADNYIFNEIHVFTDSSEKAYGACVYIRSIGSGNAVIVRLLASKNRIAPIKPTTMPRLELCGALVGSRLCTKVKDSLTIPVSRSIFWCDSTIVLSWLSAPSTQLKPFVRHRVNEIQESTLGSVWNYVPTRDNPADLVSRGVKADHISDSSLWWTGPSFLLKEECLWPKLPNDIVKQDLPELKCHVTQASNDHIQNQTIIQQLIHKYSDFNHLLRNVAYIKRYIHNLKNKDNKLVGFLHNKEIQSSLKCILRNAQSEIFSDEYIILKAGKSLPHKNRLLSLSPFIDSDDIIRVGGRLDNSPYEYDVKHPILLCSKHHLTKILFQNAHRKLLHAGPQLLLATIRQNYWPLGGRNLSRITVQRCVVCFRHKAQNVQPIMGQLPNSRSNLEFPFLNSSVDYAGPILIADRKGRGCKLIKSYICIFVCLAVKAVHLELVTDLTKEAYMAALKRFIARRGKPRSILSDNGTTFVGANNQLRLFLQNSNVAGNLAQEGIEFHFVPAYTPHFNGVAEAAVRSTKHHLKRLLKLTYFTYEEMATCLTQIEAILNSRPLTPCSPDPHDLCALTPSHFLIGRPLTLVPHPQIGTDSANISRLERLQRVEFIKQHFWQRFNCEYVSLLQQKTKWSTSSGDIKVGSLVLVKDKTLPPLCWMLGRVVRTYPGSDGVARVAELKIKGGTIRRAFNVICPLPLH